MARRSIRPVEVAAVVGIQVRGVVWGHRAAAAVAACRPLSVEVGRFWSVAAAASVLLKSS